jgi:gluconate 2-dehydrogenase gamma chain
MPSSSRRKVLKFAALAPTLAVAPIGWLRDAIPAAEAYSPDYASPPEAFFTAAERDFVDIAVSRIIPADDLGPGAREAGVTAFIDHQLAGPFGRAETWYMRGPWRSGIDEQGYQLPFTPAQLYRVSIDGINTFVVKKYQKRFADLDGGTQDKILDGIDKDKLRIPDVHARAFFEMLVQNTVEGFLADPIYGGNRDFIGWKLIGFPGPRYNYVEEIEQYGQQYGGPLVSIAGNERPSRKG